MMNRMEETDFVAGCPITHPPATSLQDAREGEAPAEPRQIRVLVTVKTVGQRPAADFCGASPCHLVDPVHPVKKQKTGST